MPTMTECIRETGVYVLKAATGDEPVFGEISRCDLTEVVLCGSGSSHHAATMVQDIMQHAMGVPVSAIYPFQADGRRYADAARTLFIGISQSGTSASTLRAMQEAEAAGCPTAAVSTTNDDGTVINGAARYIITVPCGVEADLQPKTEGTICMAASLLILALTYGSAHGEIDEAAHHAALGHLCDCSRNMESVIDAAEEWVAAHGNLIARSRDIKIIGSRTVFGAVLEGGLKLLETIRAPVAAYEVEEFVHGPYNSVNEDSMLILVGEEDSLVTKLAPIVREWTPNVIRASPGADHPLDFDLPTAGATEYLGFEALLWLYVICDRVSALKHINTMVTKDPLFHARLGSKVLR